MTPNEMRSVLLGFDARHHLDWLRDIGGCETCGPEYEVNCSCGWGGDSGYYREHIREAIGSWLGDDVPLWEGDF